MFTYTLDPGLIYRMQLISDGDRIENWDSLDIITTCTGVKWPIGREP